MTWKWARRRHPNKPLFWVKNKYFQKIANRDWRFMEKDNPEPLLLLGSIHIKRHIKIKAEVNPYDSKWRDYLNNRLTLNSQPGV
jgi:RNA-directed DNA polymerase